jgi:hypothetical protein
MSQEKINLNNGTESTESSESEEGNIIIHQDDVDCLSEPEINLEEEMFYNEDDLVSGSEDFSSDDSFSESISYDSIDEEFLKNLDSDSDIDLKIILKFGYLVDVDGQEEIRIDSPKEKIIDTGLVAGITQCDELVDAYFIDNKKMEELKNDIKFEKDFVNANGKKYKYNEIRVQMNPNEAIIVSNEDEFIIKLEDDAHDMFSSMVEDEEENTCIISVMDSKICACYISDGEILWVKDIDIGKNKFDEEKSEITTKNKEVYNLEDCYLRACVKKIYLHADSEDPPKTMILGKTNNPFSEKENQIINAENESKEKPLKKVKKTSNKKKESLEENLEKNLVV